VNADHVWNALGRLLGESDNSCPERFDLAAYQGVCLCPVLLCQELRSSSPVRLRIFFSELTSVNCVRLLLAFFLLAGTLSGVKARALADCTLQFSSPPGFAG